MHTHALSFCVCEAGVQQFPCAFVSVPASGVGIHAVDAQIHIELFSKRRKGTGYLPGNLAFL